MSETKTKKASTSFLDEVASIPGGEAIRSCIQCGVCTGSCPTAASWDYPPRKAIAMVKAGLKKELLSSNSMWFCASCYLCTVRCPRDIKPTDIMHALEVMAVREGLATGRSRTPVFYQTFAECARNNGRVHELGVIAKSYLRTGPLEAVKDTFLGLGLLFHGRLPMRSKKIKAIGDLKAILEKARAMEGAK